MRLQCRGYPGVAVHQKAGEQQRSSSEETVGSSPQNLATWSSLSHHGSRLPQEGVMEGAYSALYDLVSDSHTVTSYSPC